MASTSGMAVQVGGRTPVVEVGLGTNIVGAGVAGGNGLNGVVGFEKISPTTKATMITPRTKKIEKISQKDGFIFDFTPVD
jgi:hypothetical protein